MRKVFFIILIILFGCQVASSGSLIDCKDDDGTDARPKCTATKGAIAINTDWFPSDILVGDSNYSNHYIFQFRCPTSTVVNLQVEPVNLSGAVVTSTAWDFNAGVALTADAGYSFGYDAFPNTKLNIQHESGTQNCKTNILVDNK